MNTLIHAIDDRSGYYRLRLNRRKYVAMETNKHIKFGDGQKSHVEDSTTYLGRILHKKSYTKGAMGLRN